jgi:hypothetical protein
MAPRLLAIRWLDRARAENTTSSRRPGGAMIVLGGGEPASVLIAGGAVNEVGLNLGAAR